MQCVDDQSEIDNRRQGGGEDSDDDMTPKDPLMMRDYQMELAENGLNGHNCVIVAPTGSGKTHVALKIVKVLMLLFKNHNLSVINSPSCVNFSHFGHLI